MSGTRAHRLCAIALSLTAIVAAPAQVIADDTGDQSTGIEDIGAGLRAIDMLQDLKVAYDRRLADCVAAGEAQAYCGCINSRATLDLTYEQFVAVVHDGDPGRAGRRFQIPAARAAEAIAAAPACHAAQ